MRRTGSGGTARDFCYDANGNQLKGWNYERARERLIAWNSYNLPATITEGASSVSFSYGADRQRFRQVNSFANQTTIYVGGLYEKEITGTFAKHVNYIFAGGHAVAVLNSATDNSTAMQYLHRDHLGSVTHLTDQSGAVVESLSYDIWGKRRNSNWTDAASALPPTQSQRGFTGHEGLDDVNVVHMNGRVYDASLGKMLSADPYVQFPDHSQSFNRYSYVLNNPGSYTDPSGFCIAGFACPTSGLAGFTAGRAGSLNRAGLARASVTVVTSAFRSFSGGGFSFSRQWGGGLGHASCIVDSGGCGSPYILNFRSWSRGDAFGGWWSMFAAWVSTVSSHQTYVYVNASVDRPDGQGGSDALHALAVNERNFAGFTDSPLLSSLADPSRILHAAEQVADAYSAFRNWLNRPRKPWHAGIGLGGATQGLSLFDMRPWGTQTWGFSGDFVGGLSSEGSLLDTRLYAAAQMNVLFGAGHYAGYGIEAEFGRTGIGEADGEGKLLLHEELNASSFSTSLDADPTQPVSEVEVGGYHARFPFGRLGYGRGAAFGAGPGLEVAWSTGTLREGLTALRRKIVDYVLD